MKKIGFFTLLFLWFCLASCKIIPEVHHTAAADGSSKDEHGAIAAGPLLKPININWYAVLFYGTLICFALYLAFKNDGGDDKNNNEIDDSSEPPPGITGS
jgi:hypothetical protein